MPTNNLIQLLNPPPQDMTNDILVRQWMVNTYTYLVSLGQQVNNLPEPATPLTIEEVQDNIDQTLSLLETKTLLQTITASSSTNLDCLSFGGYENILLKFQNIIISAGTPTINLNFAPDGLVTIDSGTNYGYQSQGYQNNTSSVAAAAGTTAIVIAGAPSAVATATPISGLLDCFNINQIVNPINCQGRFSYLGSTSAAFNHITGRYSGGSPPNSFRLTLSSGTFVSGTIKVYGYN